MTGDEITEDYLIQHAHEQQGSGQRPYGHYESCRYCAHSFHGMECKHCTCPSAIKEFR